ncbi:MAG: xanthine dehydrogenase family protein subunit M [Anaerolineaceae bacterium]|nr:xanthine dehydrogenase family protein subunit M [Anaerolineaceae bacterium]MBN2676509.1 xanthine dehydrogenase family protein subunit M [Anaerolineaceae bacterium]
MNNAHPGLPEFDYIKPATLAEASQFLVQHENESRPFMGGTDIIVRMRDGFWKDKYLVEVKHLEGMTSIHFDPVKGLTIGAATSMNNVAAHPDIQRYYPLLAEAANSVASYQLRNRATVVGNICNASPAGDTTGASMVLGGVLSVHGAGGLRTEPLTTFFLGPGKTVLKPGDIVTAITFPIPPKGWAGKYIKLGRNALSDLSIVGVTVLGYPDAATKSGYRFHIVLASVAPVPFVAAAAEAVLAEKTISDDVLDAAAAAAMDGCKPIDDVRSSARYRKLMVRNLTRKALDEVWTKIK